MELENIKVWFLLDSGIDTLRDEVFEIRKLGLNSTSFKVQIDISGSTTILLMNIPYLAIDPNFPHHLNSFDNVPINYGRTLVIFKLILGKHYSKINFNEILHKYN
jgi:hypothetical protein